MRLVLWDVDRTLLVAGPAAVLAFGAAFTAHTGTAWAPHRIDAAGRSDLWIAPALFAQHGVALTDPPAFFARYAAEFAARRGGVATRGTLLPGAAAVLAALAARPDVVQTLVTGNIRAVGIAKVAAFGLDRHLAVELGGYGDESAERPVLVGLARGRAQAVYGPFRDSDVVVVGDTPHDVTAARAAGAVAVGVATGSTTAPDLRAAGADHVLPDLADVGAVVALLAGPGPSTDRNRGRSPGGG